MAKDNLQSRALRRLLLSPAALLPMLAGLTITVISVLLRGFGGRYLYLFGVGLVVLGFVVATLNVLFRSKTAMARLEREDRKRVYRQLRRRLYRVRQEQATDHVRTLETIEKRMERGRRGEGFSIPDTLDPMLTALHGSCLDALQRAAALADADREVQTPEVRDELIRDRQRLLVEVDAGVAQLTATLDRLQADGLTRPADDSLQEVRDDLERSLEVARRVEERLEELERSVDLKDWDTGRSRGAS